MHSHFSIHTEEGQSVDILKTLCLPAFIHADIQVLVVWSHKLTSSNLSDNGCNGATRPLAFSVTHHHACVETGWQLGALGPSAVADGAFRGWTVAHCVYHIFVIDSKMPPTSLADMCRNFVYKPSSSSEKKILLSDHQHFMVTAAFFLSVLHLQDSNDRYFYK